jgi:hypothetical protein
MRNLAHSFVALAAAAVLTNLVSDGKAEAHLGEYGPAFPAAPLTGQKMESHMGEYGPAFPVDPLMGQGKQESHMGEAGPPFSLEEQTTPVQ